MDPATIGAIFSGLALLITTLVGAYLAVIAARVKSTGEVIKVLEKNTNSLAIKAEAAAHALGKLEEKTESAGRKVAAQEAVAAIIGSGMLPIPQTAPPIDTDDANVKIGDTVKVKIDEAQ